MNHYQIRQNSTSERTVFGLVITAANGESFSFENISECRSDVERLAKQMSSDDISPVHFSDIVCDYIVKLASEKIELITK